MEIYRQSLSATKHIDCRNERDDVKLSGYLFTMSLCLFVGRGMFHLLVTQKKD